MKSGQLNINRYNSRHRPACMDAFLSNVPESFTVPEIAQYESWLDLIQKEEERHHYFVAFLNEQLVACGGFSYNENDTVSFTWGLVHKKFHQQRIGEQLLTYRLQKIRELYPTIDVVLDTTQHSYGFFERYGFAIVKFTENGYAQGMHRYDMVLKAT